MEIPSCLSYVVVSTIFLSLELVANDTTRLMIPLSHDSGIFYFCYAVRLLELPPTVLPSTSKFIPPSIPLPNHATASMIEQRSEDSFKTT
jgi:hypothetical protein